MKIKTISFFVIFFFFWGGGGGVRRGVRVDVSGEVNFLCKLKKKWGGGGSRTGVGVGEGDSNVWVGG